MKLKELKKFKKQLEALKNEILNKGSEKIKPNRDNESERSDEDAQALNEMNQAIASRHNKLRSGSLAQINAALRKIIEDPEDFGLCEECDEPIKIKRLELMPYSEYCVSCQSQFDQPRTGGRRKLTDYVD